MADVSINLAESNPLHQTGFNLSLLKVQTIAQVVAGLAITTAVVAATVVATTIFVTTVKYDYPEANPDIAYTWKKTAIPIYVLTNDKDPRDAALTVDSVTQGQYGTTKISPDRTFVIYTPNDRYAGVDYFNYTAKNDKLTGSSMVTVYVKNHAPDVFDQNYDINKNSQNNKLDVFAYKNPTTGLLFSDLDQDPLTLTSCTPASFGQISIADNSPVYTPNFNFNGQDSSNCTVTDGNATVHFVLNLRVFNSPPVAYPDFITVPKNTIARIPVLVNDIDINNDPLNVTWVGNIGKGNAYITDDNKMVEYTPTWTAETTTDSMEYSCTDGFFTASSYVVITLQNSAPIAKDITKVVAKNSMDNVVSFTLCDLKNLSTPYDYCDTDIAEVTQIAVTSQNSKTSKWELQNTNEKKIVSYGDDKYVLLDKNTYQFVFTPNAGQQYTDTFSYKVTDSGGLTATAKINLVIGNQPPTAPSLTATCSKRLSTPVNIMLGNPKPYDTDGDSVALSSVQSITGTKGSVVLLNSTHATYTAPANGFTGVDTFTYTVHDIQADPSENLYTSGTIQVTIINDPPIPYDDNVVVHKGIPFSIPVLANDVDPNSDDIFANTVGETIMKATTSVVDVPLNGKQVNHIQYTSLNNVYTDSFKYNIRDVDGAVSVNMAQVTVSVVNDKPVANADSYTVFWNSTNTFNVLSNDDDVNPGDKDILYIDQVSAPSHGTVTNKGNSLLYSPTLGFTGTDTFTYTIKDQFDSSSPATVTVTVINNAPVAVADTATKHHLTPFIYIDVLANDNDPQGDPIALLSTNNNRATVVSANGKTVVQYTSEPGFVGQDTFTYTITDWGRTATGTVTVTVTDTAPIAVADQLSIHWSDSSQKTISVLANDSDQEDDPLTLKSVTTPSKGTASTSGNNVLYNGPGTGFSGPVTMNYQVSDGAMESTGTITVSVTNNAKPTALPLTAKAHWRTQTSGTTINVISSTTDTDGDTVSFTTSAAVKGGTVTKLDDFNVNYKNQGWVGTDSFGYTVTDGLHSASSTVQVTIYNNPPVANNISIFLPPNNRVAGILIPVMESVTDDDAADVPFLSLTSIGTSPNTQSLQIETGKVRYIPAESFGGLDTFTYTVSDGLTNSIGYVFVTVASAVTASATNTSNILWNTQSTGSTFTVTQNLNALNIQATKGTCVLVIPSTIKYTQNTNYLGGDYCRFYYTTESSTTNTLDYYFNVYDTPPTANSFSQSVHWRTLLEGVNFNVAQGAADEDAGDTVTLKSATNGERGTTSLASGQVRYQANSAFLGEDAFTFTVTDGLLNTVRPAIITSTNANKPSAISLTQSIHWRTITTGDVGLQVDVLGSTTDADGDTLTLTLDSTTTSTGGRVSIVNGGKSVSLKHQNYVGQDQITGKVSDGIQTATVSITVTITNTKPSPVSDSYSYHWKVASAGVVLAPSPKDNDVDANADPLTLTKVGTQFTLSGSSASLNSGSIKYTAPASTTGTDTFSYSVSDTIDEVSSSVSVTLTNTAPVAPPVAVSTLWRTPVLVAATCTDADSDPITGYALSTSPQRGSYSIGTGSGMYTPTTISYSKTPDVDGKYKGTDSWTYTCTDSVATSTGTMSVTVYNTPPVTVADSFSFQHNYNQFSTALDVMINDSDPDGDTLLLDSLVSSSQGSVVSVSNGKINYTPRKDFVGTDTLSYSVFDGNLHTTGSVTVTMQNTPPTCNNVAKTGLVKQQAYTYNLINEAQCSDVNNDPLTVTILTGPTKGVATLGNDGKSITYTSNARRSGVDTITFQVSDGYSTISKTLTLTISNRAPSTVNPSYSSMISESQKENIFSVVSGVTDADTSDSIVLLSVTPNTCSGAGTFSLVGNTVKYMQKAAYSGNCVFQFSYRDNDQDSPATVNANANLYITNSPPVAVDDYFTTDQGSQLVIPIVNLTLNDVDLAGRTLSFNGIVCRYPGVTCLKTPEVSGSTITIPADSTTCGNLRFEYSIITPDGQTAIGSFYVKYINCRCLNPADIVFVLDGSGSIASADWTRAKTFVKNMVGSMTISQNGLNVGVVQYGTNSDGSSVYVSNQSPRGFVLQKSSSSAVQTLVDGLSQYRGGTPTLYGLQLGISTLQAGRANVPKILVLVTDGAPSVPCSCSECTTYYTTYYQGGNQNNCTEVEYFPTLTCSTCDPYGVYGWNSAYADSMKNLPHWCMPCADFRRLCKQVNSWNNWKVVTVGIGSIPELGKILIAESAYTASAAFFPTNWVNLNNIYQKIVDESCA